MNPHGPQTGPEARAAASELLAVAVITGTHGVAGELKARSLSGELDHLLTLSDALLRKAGRETTVCFESVRRQVPGILLKVKGIDSPEKARALIGSEIWVPRSLAAPLDRGEYYAADLCQCSLWYGEEEIGVVRSVWDGGPAQLLEVRGKEGRTFLVPFSEHFIGDVELEKGRIRLKEDEIIR